MSQEIRKTIKNTKKIMQVENGIHLNNIYSVFTKGNLQNTVIWSLNQVSKRLGKSIVTTK